MMLEAKPAGLFSRDFAIEAAGQGIASLDVSFWREASAVTIEGRPYRLYREGLMSGAFVLENEGRIVARAIKPSAFLSRFELELEGRRYLLARASFLGRRFSVLKEGREVGTIRPYSLFTRRAIIDLPADWPLPIKVFVFWLVLVIWNRDNGAAATAGAGG